MTAETRRIVLRAIDEAFAMSVINLYEVVNADTSDESIERFAAGLRKTVDLHDRLIEALRQQENGNGV
jgi:hypothetical protein